MSDIKGLTSGVVREGDILVIEGGIAKHIIIPKKRGEKVAGAYATVYDGNLIPRTVYVDVKEVGEDEIPQIEDIARTKAVGDAKKVVRLDKSGLSRNQGSKPADGSGTTSIMVTVISISEPKKEGDVLVAVAAVEGPKGRFNVVARGKHAERLIALEGQRACLQMKKKYDKEYKAYEAAEVHFSEKRAVVETVIYSRGGDFLARGQEGREAKLTAYDLETIEKLEKYSGKKVRLTLEHSEINQGDFVVTEIVPVEASTKEMPVKGKEAQASIEEIQEKVS